MVLEVDGRRAAGFRIIRNAWDRHHFHVFGSGWEGGEWHQKRIRAVSIFMVLEVGGKGAVGPRIIRNALDCFDFRGFASAWEGSGWL